MKDLRASSVVYVLALILLAIGIALVYAYASSPYIGAVQISFHVEAIAYNGDGGDYASIRLDGLMINFSRAIPQIGNHTTRITSYLGRLNKTLDLSLNLTLTSSLNHIVLPTSIIEFSNPGTYAVTFVHLFPDVPPGVYLANLTYTENVHRYYPYQLWTSTTYYFEVE